jgi:protein involved in polysaccharide export with SLBB domain
MYSRSSLRMLHAHVVLGLLCTAALAACADGGGAPLSALKQDPEGLSRAYRLGVGDKLKVTVFGEQDLSGAYEVNAAGQLPLPLIGDIPAKGQPIAAVRDAIAGRLSQGYLKQPRVSVEVLNYRPIYVHGEVRSGGEFPYRPGLKMRDAVAVAGGYTYRANQGYALLTREGGQVEVRVPLPSDIDVLPGDNIRIPERFF